MRLFAVLCLLAGLAAPVGAHEIITYAGTIGARQVIVEMTAPLANGRVIARFAFLDVGVDIPLNGQKAANGVVFAEEAPCSNAVCLRDDGNHVLDPPVSAEWTIDGDPGAHGSKHRIVRSESLVSGVIGEDQNRVSPAHRFGYITLKRCSVRVRRRVRIVKPECVSARSKNLHDM